MGPSRSFSRRVWLLAALFLFGALLVGGAVWWLTNAGTTKASLAPLDPQQVACGRIVYETFCVQCHGQRGEGQPNWQLQNPDDTYPPPPHDSSGHTWHHGDSYLYRIVREGGKFNETPGFKSAMPAWGSILSLEEISAVITYLKSLWGSREREYQAQATLQELRH